MGLVYATPEDRFGLQTFVAAFVMLTIPLLLDRRPRATSTPPFSLQQVARVAWEELHSPFLPISATGFVLLAASALEMSSSWNVVGEALGWMDMSEADLRRRGVPRWIVDRIVRDGEGLLFNGLVESASATGARDVLVVLAGTQWLLERTTQRLHEGPHLACSVIGVDASEECVTSAAAGVRARGYAAGCVELDVRCFDMGKPHVRELPELDLPVLSESVDSVLCGRVLSAWGEEWRDRLFARAWKALRPGGTFAFLAESSVATSTRRALEAAGFQGVGGVPVEYAAVERIQWTCERPVM
jgi:SAM-dependent methyltransferase